MREKRLSIFAGNVALNWESAWIRHSIWLLRSKMCALEPCNPSRRLTVTFASPQDKGWAWDRKAPAAARIQVVATADGVIVGLGAMGDWRPNRPRNSSLPEDQLRRIHRICEGARKPSAPLSIYAVTRREPPEACTFANCDAGCTVIYAEQCFSRHDRETQRCTVPVTSAALDSFTSTAQSRCISPSRVAGLLSYASSVWRNDHHGHYCLPGDRYVTRVFLMPMAGTKWALLPTDRANSIQRGSGYNTANIG